MNDLHWRRLLAFLIKGPTLLLRLPGSFKIIMRKPERFEFLTANTHSTGVVGMAVPLSRYLI